MGPSHRERCPEEILENIKKRIRNVTIRQQIGLEETVIRKRI
jgi:hypothetical protein